MKTGEVCLIDFSKDPEHLEPCEILHLVLLISPQNVGEQWWKLMKRHFTEYYMVIEYLVETPPTPRVLKRKAVQLS